ncbi:aryl carrier-like protein [Saccharothrix tamanrassetensis]|uniref:Aryl carrier-like protein n=1 Tax=Saccharothrix tamanrassetensis TaxID=1051531 RepID=A0A841CDI9_9PSEU|nr:phosphopantetheine-binding protein [Saccharothrix tamanrassetensis]MBB5953826.1 aryl carrier-like protein [Saccharothrix tamanrassetensis]
MTGRDAVREHVAEVLGQPAGSLDDHEDLLDRGVDSIRLMHLVERLRESGVDAEFVDLAETPTIAAWADLAGRRARA